MIGFKESPRKLHLILEAFFLVKTTFSNSQEKNKAGIYSSIKIKVNFAATQGFIGHRLLASGNPHCLKSIIKLISHRNIMYRVSLCL